MSKTDKKKTIVGGSQTPPIVYDKVTVATPQPTTPTPATQETQPQPAQPAQPAVTQPTTTAPDRPQTAPTTTLTTADVGQPAVQTLPVNVAQPPATLPTAPNPNLLPNNNIAAPPATLPTPQYADKAYTTSSDVDTRNQQLSGQVDKPVQTTSEEATMAPTLTIYATDMNGQVIYDEQGNPVPLNLQPQTGTSPVVRSLPTETPASDEETDDDGIVVKGKRYDSYADAYADLAHVTSDEDKEREMRRERRNALISALGDGLSSLSNLYFTTKGAPDQGLKPNLTEASKKRMDDLRARWQAEKDKYDALLLKGIDADREQGNWLASYRQKERESQLRYQKYMETERPKALAQIEKTKLEIQKIKNDNEIDEATKEKRLEAKQKELDLQISTLDFQSDPDHYGMTPEQYAKYEEDKRHNRNQESLGWANHRESVRNHKASEDGGGLEIISASGGYKFSPTKQQINSAYAYLLSRGLVGADATTTAQKVNEIQQYYSDGVARTALGRTRSKGKFGNKVDALLGGSVNMETGEYNY